MAISTTSYSPNGWVTIAGTSYRFKRYSGGGGDYTDCLTFTGETSEFTLAVGSNGAKEWDGTLYYSTDHNTWNVWDGTAISSANKKLYLRGKGNTKFWTSNGARLSLSAKASCSGNIQTLLDWENPPTSIPTTDCYSRMFRGCTNLTTAPALPATTLANYCYYDMFLGCTNLTTAPNLPATTLANSCYYGMFVGCTNLTTAPNLPATTLADYCYGYMFRECTNLTTAPNLPATTLADYCYYYMFDSCTNLTAAPELPAITLAQNCYRNMFSGCTKLKLSTTQTTEYKTPWRIPSSGTISSEPTNWNTDMLTGTGGRFTGNPNINTTYYGAWGTSGGGDYTDCLTFTGETSEFTLAVGGKGAKEWDGTLYYSTDHNTWNVWDGTAINSANKKLYLRGKGNTTFSTSQGARLSLSAKAGCSGNIQTLLDWESPPTSITGTACYQSMFDGCTNLTTAPSLPATTLASNCYASMFYNCGNLATAPALPATTLAQNCYNGMFNSCTSLTTAPALPATTLARSCYSYMFQGCTNLTTTPALPATTLAVSCYYGMFNGCTSLTTAPSLPATTLADYCYYGMFRDCTKLKLSTTQTTEYKTPWRIPSSGTISSEPSNWNTYMLTGTGGTFTGNPSINTTYYGA